MCNLYLLLTFKLPSTSAALPRVMLSMIMSGQVRLSMPPEMLNPKKYCCDNVDFFYFDVIEN